MNTVGNLQLLRSMQSLGDVGDDALHWLADHVTAIRFKPGDEFITQGDPTRDCYFIVSGETSVSRNGSELGITGPGEPEGEVAMFLGIPRTATTTAITDVMALRLDAGDFDALRASNRELAERIRVGICSHLARRFGVSSFAGVGPRSDVVA
jgi:CRP-like cAMP-binding protein